jgi:hypothetical protein
MELLLPRAAEDPVDTKKKLQSWGAGESMGMTYGYESKPCTPVVHINIAGKWMFIPLKMVLTGIDP